MKKVICFFAVVALLAGCSQFSKPSAIPKVIGSPQDYGAYPTNYQDLVGIYCRVFLKKDPASLPGLKVSKPQPYFLQKPSALGMTYYTEHSLPSNAQMYGYMVPFNPKPKDSFNVFTDNDTYYLFTRAGKIVDCINDGSVFLTNENKGVRA